MRTKYIEIIRRYLLRYEGDDNVLAIILTGSVGRGCNDDFSDVDYVKVVNKRETVGGFKEVFEGIVFDCRIETYDFLEKNPWTMDQFYAYFNSVIYTDKEGKVKSIIEKKKVEWERYNKRLVAVRLVELSVNLSFPKSYDELRVPMTHFEKFIKRQDYYSALNCLQIIEQQLISLCYIANKFPVPDGKNMMRNITDLEYSEILMRIPFTISNIGDFEELQQIYHCYTEVLGMIIMCIERNFVYEKGIKSLKWYYYKYRRRLV